MFDALIVAAFIEARSHERLSLLARGFADSGDGELADFYAALAGAEERHAEIFVELARPLLPVADGDARVHEMALRESEILAALPHATRIH
jgi:tRNA-(ms[2]io[6]A)-hydroxylase